MELDRSATSEGESSTSCGISQRKRKPIATSQPGGHPTKRQRTNLPPEAGLRRSARLIARRQQIVKEEQEEEEREKSKPPTTAVSSSSSSSSFSSKPRNSRGSSSVSKLTTTTTSSHSKRRQRERQYSTSSQETVKSSSESLGDKDSAPSSSSNKSTTTRSSSRKRKRSNSPREGSTSTKSSQKGKKESTTCVQGQLPPLRRSLRSTRKVISVSSKIIGDLDTDTNATSGPVREPKSKKRLLSSSANGTTQTPNTTTTRNQRSSSTSVTSKTDKPELAGKETTTSPLTAKESSSSVTLSVTHKGNKRREKSKKLSADDTNEPQPKRSTRRRDTAAAGKEPAAKETVAAEEEFDRHGRRPTGKSVICEPQKGKGKSAKGKGRARTEVSRQSSGPSTCVSLPSFIDFGRLSMSESDKATASGGEVVSGKPATEAGGSSEGASQSTPNEETLSLAASVSEESQRLQSMLEAQGLPPHLLGALGSKMQYILHKSFSSMSSSNSSRAHQLLSDMESGDESTQLQACIEVGQLLVMGNEETLAGFPVKQAVPILSNLLSLEHNFDMMVQACRALSYMMDALPRSSSVVAKTIPLLVEKLQVIQCMDVAEQALSALELLSRRHGKDILQAGGLNASLAYLDFFSLTTQRRALSVTANCCYSLSEDDFPLVVDSVPILTARLQHQDKKSVESCCQCFSRLVESFNSNQSILRQVVTTALLQNLQQLLIVSPPVISSSSFVSVLRMLSTLCSVCPPLAVELLQINIAETLRYLLAGSGEITLDNIELMSRTPTEVYEILSLTGHLMPPLPKDGIFEIETIISSKKHAPTVVQWEWQENEGSWRSYNSLDNRNIEMAHLAHEEECSISVMGRDYTIDLGTMQQINEDTGTTRAVRRKVLDKVKPTSDHPSSTMDVDARAVALNSDPSLGSSFVKALFPVLYELFNSMAGSSVHNKCLKTILRILYHSDSKVLEDILRDISVSSHIATMLKSKDSHTIVGGIQMAHILMEKLPDIFLIFFHREGVIHEVRALKESPLKLLPTPRKEERRTLLGVLSPPLPPGHPSSSSEGLHPDPSSVGGVLAQATPPGPSSHSSTRKRLSDIIRRGKRHFRRSLTRGRSEEEHGLPPPPASLIPKVPLQPPTTSVATPPRAIPSRSSSFSFSSSTDHHPLRTPPTSQGSKLTTEEVASSSPGAVSVSSSGGGGGSVKEKVNSWIHCQLETFLEKWVPPDQSHPALDAVRRLSNSVGGLSLSSSDHLETLKTICSILMDPEVSISSFEIMHSSLVPQLTSFLTVEAPECVVPLNSRLKAFVHVFLGIPEHDTSLADWTPPPQLALLPLLQKLHGCVGQLEQFSVRVNDMPGRRGSQALRFFNSHQIKCSLERHSSAPSSISNWKGGPLRIDPLATLQTLERYLVVRGIGKSDQATKRLEDFEFGDEVDESTITGPLPTTDRHHLEFLINEQVVHYNMTIFQAIRQYAVSSAQESEDDSMPLGRPEIWIRTHTIHYRPTASSPGPGNTSKVLSSSSLPPSAPQETASASASPVTKKSSSSGGGRKRPSSAKAPLSVPTLFPRVTRSSSREKTSSGGAQSTPPPPLRPFRSPSLPTTTPPLPMKTSTHSQPPPPTPPLSSATTITKSPERVVSKKSPPIGPVSKEKQKKYGGGLSPLHQALKQSKELSLSTDDPSLPLLRLLKVVYSINNHWTDLYQGVAGNPVVPLSEFVNNKLTSKTSRQTQDPLNVMTGSFPLWLKDLTKHCPFLFPFECRQTLFYITTFDRDRAIARLQEQRPELTTADSASSSPSQTVSPKFSKKKRCVARERLLEQGEKIINELASNRAMLEIHYEDEVGTGLGPTLEFYTLMSREFQRADLSLWRGELCPPLPGASPGAANTPLYVHSPVGLFPAPLGPSTSYAKVEEVCSKFKFLGKFISKALMDSRMLDVPLSDAFYKWMLGQQGTFTAQDLQYVDPVVARSFAQLATVAVKKHKLESDPLLSDKALSMGIESLSLEGGGSIDDLDLDFTLPGYPDIELKLGGKDIAVNIHNLDEYLKLVVDWTLVRGVARQMEAFKEGVSSVLPLSSLQTFYPSEMDQLLCGANHQKWDVKELMEYCRPDHGYSHDSPSVQNLFEVLSTYDTVEQRQFIQFVTGSPRLPVGGFKALNPQLTIVRKTVESPQNADEFLPSVMTCVNYLKLPDYSTVEVMREKLGFALREGKDCFHLS